MNHTTNYQLSQWAKPDKVQMEDFNADNAKIDAAIKAEANARTSAVNTLTGKIAKLGNCKIVYQTYTGDGTCGENHPKVFTYPSKPLLVVFGIGRAVAVTFYGSTGFTTTDGTSHWTYSITWGTNSFSMMHTSDPSYQFNEKGIKYTVITLLAADG